MQPGTGRIFINDVGQDTWEEINDGIKGSNYGWPGAEGQTSCSTYRCPLFVYGHGSGDTLGCAITGGTFYNPKTQQFPSDYAGDYFFADYCNNWIRKFDPQNNTVAAFATDVTSATIDLKVSSAGSLYYLSRGGSSSAGTLRKIRYTASQAPSISTQPVSQTSSIGQPATFTVVASGSVPLSYQWQRNQTDISGATAASYTLPDVQLSDDGDLFRCIVTNSYGSATSNEAKLTVTTDSAPTATIINPPDGTLYNAGDTINYSGSGTDPEDGTLSANAFTWQIDFHHEDHIHPFIPATSGSKSGSFTIPTTGETSSQVWYRIILTVRDSEGLTNTTYRDILPHTSRVTLTTNPTGLQLKLDGASVTTPFWFIGVVGITRTIEAVTPQTLSGTTYQFSSWSDGGARIHTISTPSTNKTYNANYSTSGTTTGDGLAGSYYDNSDFTGTNYQRVDPVVNFDWLEGSPAPGISSDTFSVRWTGFVQPRYSQTYTFYTLTDDGVRLWVNGQLLIDEWIINPGELTATMMLTAGQKYSIKMEFYDSQHRALARLSWSSASQAKQVIPQSRLYSK